MRNIFTSRMYKALYDCNICINCLPSCNNSTFVATSVYTINKVLNNFRFLWIFFSFPEYAFYEWSCYTNLELMLYHTQDKFICQPTLQFTCLIIGNNPTNVTTVELCLRLRSKVFQSYLNLSNTIHLEAHRCACKCRLTVVYCFYCRNTIT